MANHYVTRTGDTTWQEELESTDYASARNHASGMKQGLGTWIHIIKNGARINVWKRDIVGGQWYPLEV